MLRTAGPVPLSARPVERIDRDRWRFGMGGVSRSRNDPTRPAPPSATGAGAVPIALRHAFTGLVGQQNG